MASDPACVQPTSDPSLCPFVVLNRGVLRCSKSSGIESAADEK
jgi:hypothetical protein